MVTLMPFFIISDKMFCLYITAFRNVSEISCHFRRVYFWGWQAKKNERIAGLRNCFFGAASVKNTLAENGKLFPTRSLEAYNLEIGLLINFGEMSLNFKRLTNKKFKEIPAMPSEKSQ